MGPRGRKQTDVVSENITQGKPIDMQEIGSPGPIEPVASHMFKEAAELEAFMQEVLTIVVHPDSKEGSLDVITPNVGGINQPIIRGVNSKVKRKYVEALARGRTETYVQRQTDPSDRASLKMVPRSVVTYPFSVIHDPNDKGREWLEGILREYN